MDERTQHILEERKKETFKRIAHEIDLDGWSAAIDPDGKECNTAIPGGASIGRTSRTDEQPKKDR